MLAFFSSRICNWIVMQMLLIAVNIIQSVKFSSMNFLKQSKSDL